MKWLLECSNLFYVFLFTNLTLWKCISTRLTLCISIVCICKNIETSSINETLFSYICICEKLNFLKSWIFGQAGVSLWFSRLASNSLAHGILLSQPLEYQRTKVYTTPHSIPLQFLMDLLKRLRLFLMVFQMA